MGIGWQMVFLPVAVLGAVVVALCHSRAFPHSTSAVLGVGFGEQVGEMFRRPGFFFWCALMLATAASEIAPIQWVDIALSHVVGMRGILLVSYVSLIQFAGRHVAGPIAARLSKEGLLGLSCALCAAGLYGLGLSASPVGALMAATLWGLGICALWPTMLAVAADRYPRGGAITIGMMGAMGNLSIYFILPMLGAIYDRAKIARAGGAAAFAALSPDQMQPVLVYAAGQSFRLIAGIPAVLVVIFAIMWTMHRRRRPFGGPDGNSFS